MMNLVFFLLCLGVVRILPLKQAVLFDSVVISFWVIILRSLWKDKRRKVATGIEAMIGSKAEVIESSNGALKVFFRGEIWDAVSSEELSVRETVEILGMNKAERLKLRVGRIKDSAP